MFEIQFSRRKKHVLMIFTDIFLVSASLWLAFALRFSEWFIPNQKQLLLFVLAPALSFPIFVKFGLYREVVRYIGQRGMLAIFKATFALTLLWVFLTITFLTFFLEVDLIYFIANWLPRSIPLLFWMTLLLTIGGSRQVARGLLNKFNSPPTTKSIRNVLIYGAGRVGLELASSLAHDKDTQVLGIIDDDKTLHGHFIQNLKVLGDRTEIVKIRENTSPLEVLLATTKLQPEQRKELLKYLEDKKVIVRTIPSLNEITSREVTTNDLREILTTDLLERKIIKPKHSLLTASVSNKNILVTGAGGSIGSELCRQIFLLNPKCVVLFEHSEHSLYTIHHELLNQRAKQNLHFSVIPILGSITNKQRIEDTIKNFRIDTIYHAAAYKHVNLIERNIREGILNNIFGSYNVARAALDLNVEKFILISTDKAVRPTSIMGATKRIAELITLGLAQKNNIENTSPKSATHFAIVRFGNVLGSSGSVIPLFQQQIASGGPITITHPEVTRYFMTIAEASQLVIQAGAMAGNCNIFVLDMGNPISILSLAKQLVYLSGHMLKTDENEMDKSGIEIQYTGLRKGEKIHEELFIGDVITTTEHPLIMKAKEASLSWLEIEELLKKLEPQNNLSEESLGQLIMEYSLNSNKNKPV
jgi:UDP-N-acetylglucosamine 4,6-dehydratase